MEHLRKNGADEAIKEFAKSGKPMLGICLGMQMAVIEFARNVCKLKNANSAEINSKTKKSSELLPHLNQKKTFPT